MGVVRDCHWPLLVDGTMHPATDKRYSVVGVGFCRSRDDLVSYHRDYYDLGHLLRQIGLGETRVPLTAA